MFFFLIGGTLKSTGSVFSRSTSVKGLQLCPFASEADRIFDLVSIHLHSLQPRFIKIKKKVICTEHKTTVFCHWATIDMTWNVPYAVYSFHNSPIHQSLPELPEGNASTHRNSGSVNLDGWNCLDPTLRTTFSPPWVIDCKHKLDPIYRRSRWISGPCVAGCRWVS